MELRQRAGPYEALGDVSLENFLAKVSQSQKQTNEAGRWIQDNLIFETKRVLRQKQTASRELENLTQETLEYQIRKLKEEKTNDGYKDAFNRLVCKTADEQSVRLPEAEKIVVGKIRENLSTRDIEIFLATKRRNQAEGNLKQSLAKNLKRIRNPEKAILFTAILFEIDQMKTDNVWGLNKFEEAIIAGLNGESINLITILCLINEFDMNGNYTAVPKINAYLENQKLEPIPLVVDEMTELINFFAFYDINASLTIYVADTDYTEIGQYGPVNDRNLKNIKDYLENLKKYISKNPNVKTIPISEITSNNNKYQEVKLRILKNLDGFRDRDFETKWAKKFEDAREKVWESQLKKALFPEDEIRSKSIEITKNIWSCNAAQGALFVDLRPNTILISTERRERDMNYVIDKDTEKRFIPVLYVLKATEIWNRKLTAKNANIE